MRLATLWSKIKLVEVVSTVFVNLNKTLGIVAVAIVFLFAVLLVFFGIIFAIASSVNNTVSRMNTAILSFAGAILFFIAGSVLAYYITRKPKTIIQQLEVSGEMKAVGIRCPNCGASVDANKIKMVSGVPYATCPYCGHTFEVAEEPKW
jgi:DNA-directed RNA polymerase subunit RPC12/RpoP